MESQPMANNEHSKRESVCGKTGERNGRLKVERDQDDLIVDIANICPKSINSNTSI
jgi:hypothetical protein